MQFGFVLDFSALQQAARHVWASPLMLLINVASLQT
jgi:hypothetical protein